MVALQVLGKVPTISVEKTDGCQMFLSEDSKGVEIITAKSSEMNVSIPDGGDFVSIFSVHNHVKLIHVVNSRRGFSKATVLCGGYYPWAWQIS